MTSIWALYYFPCLSLIANYSWKLSFPWEGGPIGSVPSCCYLVYDKIGISPGWKIGVIGGGIGKPPEIGGKPPEIGGGSNPPDMGGGGGNNPPDMGGGGGNNPPDIGGGGGNIPPDMGGGGGSNPPDIGGGGGNNPPDIGGGWRSPSIGGGGSKFCS